MSLKAIYKMAKNEVIIAAHNLDGKKSKLIFSKFNVILV